MLFSVTYFLLGQRRLGHLTWNILGCNARHSQKLGIWFQGSKKDVVGTWQGVAAVPGKPRKASWRRHPLSLKDERQRGAFHGEGPAQAEA